MNGAGVVMAGAAPDFLVVGHITRDLVGRSYQPGGTAFYAALTAARMGLRVAVFTTGEAEVESALMGSGVQVVNVLSCCTTVFENSYEGEVRSQRLHSVASPIPLGQLPEGWNCCPVVLLAPVANEVAPPFVTLFPRSLLSLSLQGWLRQWDGDGKVFPCYPVFLEELAKAQVVFLSRRDLPPGETPEKWPLGSAILVVTEGIRGVTLCWEGRWYRVPAYPAHPEDFTGAGDAFAAAFLVRYHECGDPLNAALFASAAASLKVEAPGAAGVPYRWQVEERMARHPEQQVALANVES